MSDRDKYGGWTKIKFEATGFFRLEQTKQLEKQHGGLQDAFGNWHQPLADAFSQCGNDMYTCATS